MSEHDPNVVLSLQSPWKENANTVWIASSLCIKRNIDDINFPGKLEDSEKEKIVSEFEKQIERIDDLVEPYVVKAKEAPSIEKEFIFEHFLLPYSPLQASVGEAFVLDKSGSFLAALNFQDHLQLQLLDCSDDLEGCWNRLIKLESSFGESLRYAFSKRYGFLTSDPAECGTGFELSIYMQLPAMIHSKEFEDFMEKHPDESIYVSGLQGTLDEIVGDVVVIRNNYMLGCSEENILSKLRSFATKLAVYENSLRNKLVSEESADFKDMVSRAYGVMMHSYQLEASEVLSAISMLKLGVGLGWMEGVSVQELNALFFNCRRAHLMRHFKDDLALEDLAHKRAEYVHKTLKRLKLTV